MKKHQKGTLTPYMQIEPDEFVDRDKETKKLEKIIEEKLAYAYILFSQTGIGKMVDYLKKALIYGHTSRISS